MKMQLCQLSKGVYVLCPISKLSHNGQVTLILRPYDSQAKPIGPPNSPVSPHVECLPPFPGRAFPPCRHSSSSITLVNNRQPSLTMPSVVETASPHFRVSAAKASSTAAAETPSTRIPPPETSSVEDHFFWTYTEEPHRSRRQAIIKAHPEVRRYLPGPCEHLSHLAWESSSRRMRR